MSRREGFIDEAFGERRGVVLLDGKPERLIIERDGDIACQRLGARSVARVRSVERGQGIAFLSLPEGPDGVAPIGRLAEGQAVEVEVAAEARDEKGPSLTVVCVADGESRFLTAGPSLADRITAWTERAPATQGARDAADQAEEAALAVQHTLPGGGLISIEPTRALTAIDVDIADRRGGDAKRLAKSANLAAITEAARLIRLKGLGGAVVIDLVGKGHDGPAMSTAAKAAFAADEPGVSIGPISRFGLFELTVPHRFAPVASRLLDADGSPNVPTMTHRLARAIEREARAQPGDRIDVVCAPDVALAFAPHMRALTALIGERLSVVADPARSRSDYSIATR
jgi:Ribonuclease G/E